MKSREGCRVSEVKLCATPGFCRRVAQWQSPNRWIPGQNCWRRSSIAVGLPEYIADVLPSRVWRPDPPDGKDRSIAAIVSHIYD
jgi:hypothetical protein